MNTITKIVLTSSIALNTIFVITNFTFLKVFFKVVFFCEPLIVSLVAVYISSFLYEWVKRSVTKQSKKKIYVPRYEIYEIKHNSFFN